MGAKININLLQNLTGHKSAIYALLYNNNTLFSAGGDGFLVAWDLLKKNEGKVIAQCEEPIYSSLITSGNVYYLGSSFGNIFYINNQIQRKILAHKKGVFSIILFNQFIITGGADGYIRLWNQELELISEKQISSNSIRKIIVINHQIACASSDGNIYFLNNKLEIQQQLQIHTQSVFSLLHINNLLFSGGRDALLNQYNFANQKTKSVVAHNLHIHDIISIQNEHKIISASMDKTIKIWDAISLELLKVIDAKKFGIHANSVNHLVKINEHIFASASDDKTIGVWEIA